MKQALLYIKKQLQEQGFYTNNEIITIGYRILEAVCKTNKQTLLCNRDRQLSIQEAVRIREIVDELKTYRPLQYVIGDTEFYGLTFYVDETVLIPRPETEELVDLIVRNVRHMLNTRVRIFDIGTGSGCIAIALAKHFPNAEVYASDISSKVLSIARRNAYINKVHIHFFQHDVFQPFSIHSVPFDACSLPFFDLIVSNPPYIVPSEKSMMSLNVLKYEPEQALFVPEEQPLLFYERIGFLGMKYLKNGGTLYFETSSIFGKETAKMLLQMGYVSVKLLRDIFGKDRIIMAKLFTVNT